MSVDDCQSDNALPETPIFRQLALLRLLRATTWAWLVVLVAAQTLAAANDLSARFDDANRLYAQGNYPEAIVAYESFLLQQHVSAPIYFNLGNAYFRAGQIGQAIAAYRMAQRLAPRDSDIRANLRFARDKVAGNVSRRPAWQRWLNWLTIDELTLLSAGMLWSCLLTLAVGQIRRDWAARLRPYTMKLGVLALLSVIWLGILLPGRLATSSAVVVKPEAAVRYGPFEEAQSFYTVTDGVELKVRQEKNGWFQVGDRLNRVGWIAPAAVRVLPPG